MENAHLARDVRFLFILTGLTQMNEKPPLFSGFFHRQCVSHLVMIAAPAGRSFDRDGGVNLG